MYLTYKFTCLYQNMSICLSYTEKRLKMTATRIWANFWTFFFYWFWISFSFLRFLTFCGDFWAMTRCQGAFFFQVWYLLSICLSINISDDQSMPYSLSIPQYQLPISICSWCSRPTCWLATRKWSSHWNLKRLPKSTYSRAISKALRMLLEDLKFSYTFRFTFGKHVFAYHGQHTALTCKHSTQPTCDSDDVFAVLWPLHAAINSDYVLPVLC